VGLALCALGNICSAEMARDLAQEVERLLDFRDPNIRKKVNFSLYFIPFQQNLISSGILKLDTYIGYSESCIDVCMLRRGRL